VAYRIEVIELCGGLAAGRLSAANHGKLVMAVTGVLDGGGNVAERPAVPASEV
jgi:hypothetical protein